MSDTACFIIYAALALSLAGAPWVYHRFHPAHPQAVSYHSSLLRCQGDSFGFESYTRDVCFDPERVFRCGAKIDDADARMAGGKQGTVVNW